MHFFIVEDESDICIKERVIFQKALVWIAIFLFFGGWNYVYVCVGQASFAYMPECQWLRFPTINVLFLIITCAQSKMLADEAIDKL